MTSMYRYVTSEPEAHFRPPSRGFAGPLAGHARTHAVPQATKS